MDPYTYRSSEHLRCATDGGVVFSSTKCPPPANTTTGSANHHHPPKMSEQRQLEQTCELPFGFCYTPMTKLPPQLSTSLIPSLNLPSGVMCMTCMAYLNLYCETSETYLDDEQEHWMMQWKCALCQSENIVAVECTTSSNNNDYLEKDQQQQGTTVTTTISTKSRLLDTMISQRVVELRQPLGQPPPPHPPQPQPPMEPSTFTNPTTESFILPTKTIILVVDENLPSTEAHAIGNALQSILDQNPGSSGSGGNNFSWQIGLMTFGDSISIFQLGVNSGIVVADVVRSHEGFMVMTDADSGADISRRRSYFGTSINAIVSCLAAQFNSDECNSKANVSITTDSADLCNANIPKKTRMQILKERKQIRLQRQEMPPSLMKNVGDNEMLRSPWILARERIAQTKPPYRNTGDALLCAIDLASFGASSFQSSIIGTTHESALECHDCRILLFTNGCPNLGDGSVVDTENDATGGLAAFSTVDSTQMARACGFYTAIGKSAVDIGVGIDVLCTGSSELGFPAYLSLVDASSGYVISHDTFSSSRLHSNMEYILQQTHMSQSSYVDQSAGESETVYLPDSSQTLYSSRINGCSVDMRMSSFLTSTHLIGPGELVECPSEPLSNEQVAFTEGKYLAAQYQLIVDHQGSPSIDELQATLTRIRIGRYDPLSTFSVMLRVNDSYQAEEHAFFQFIVRFVDFSRQNLVTRVTSHRLSVANDVGEFLEAIDEEVVPVLLAKEAVYRSMFGRDADVDQPFHAAYVDELDSLAHDAQQDLDNTVFRISGAFRLLSLVKGTKSIDLTEEGGIKATGTSMDFAFPPELSDALRRLYHLRRGPLLSPGPVQSADDRVEIRSLFVRFPLDDCLSMMAPSLWSSGSLLDALNSNETILEDVPPETLALWENRIIAADHWNNTFLWSGSETLDPKYDVIRERLKFFLKARSKNRFPQPSFYMLTETDSMSRRFTSLLAPSHGDPVEHQLAHFHALTYFSRDELAKLHLRFRFYDPDADPSFRKWFWEVASAASTLGTEGVSLCD